MAMMNIVECKLKLIIIFNFYYMAHAAMCIGYINNHLYQLSLFTSAFFKIIANCMESTA